MRTLTIEKNIYTFDELTDEQKELAYYKNSDLDVSDYSEFEETLKEFCNIFDVNCYNWEVDSFNYDYHFIVHNRTNWEDVHGKRLAKWLYNNFYSYITAHRVYSKFYYKDGKTVYKKRTSKIEITSSCPLTGLYCDDDILYNIFQAIDGKKVFQDFEELIDACLDQFFEAFKNQVEYNESFEAFEEAAIANNWEFDENGNII